MLSRDTNNSQYQPKPSADNRPCRDAAVCLSRAPAAELGDSDAAAAGAGQALCASSCASLREAAQSCAAPEQSGAPPDLPPFGDTTEIRCQDDSSSGQPQHPGPRDEQTGDASESSPLDFISERRPLKLSGNMGMLKVARSGFCLQTDIHAPVKIVGIGGLFTNGCTF